MRARLPAALTATAVGREAEAILRACVHCGFCNATCPTYQLTGDERDGPRGRIYQMKSLLEQTAVSSETQTHLDRCLGCRSCETTCPSGVRYGRLLDIVRPMLDRAVPRTPWVRLQRALIIRLIPGPGFGFLLRLGRLLRPLLPAVLARQIPATRAAGEWPGIRRSIHWLALAGCVQPDARPSIDAAAARVLDRLDQSLGVARGSGCCGALAYHMGDHAAARTLARRNIDAWWPELSLGAHGILSTATGCTPFLKDYGELLADDPAYAERADQVARRVRDASEVVTATEVRQLGVRVNGPIAVQSPCSLQHGLRLPGAIESVLEAAGASLAPVAEGHLCCGSAGAYSLLQPGMSTELRARKVRNLQSGGPILIATANIGCMLHLEKAMGTPVMHWLEIIDDAAVDTATSSR
jgi:glycolate oxidase iron-sulfur subunit